MKIKPQKLDEREGHSMYTFRFLIQSLAHFSEPDPFRACSNLDGGACGVVFPYVETVDQVEIGLEQTKPSVYVCLDSLMKRG